jgi:hypothetical protein
LTIILCGMFHKYFCFCTLLALPHPHICGLLSLIFDNLHQSLQYQRIYKTSQHQHFMNNHFYKQFINNKNRYLVKLNTWWTILPNFMKPTQFISTWLNGIGFKYILH